MKLTCSNLDLEPELETRLLVSNTRFSCKKIAFIKKFISYSVQGIQIDLSLQQNSEEMGIAGTLSTVIIYLLVFWV